MYFNGLYHIFYQYNPKGAVWGNIVWAHSVSKDLINWKALDPAIYPSKPFDINGCWSGSATILPGNKPVILYTGIDPDNKQVQNYAIPKNISDPYLREWIKPDDNPVVFPDAGVNASAFRDPTTAWWGKDGHWRILIGGRRRNRGIAHLYRSKDFVNWVKAKHPLHSNAKTGMWECPDFFPVSKSSKRGLDTSAFGHDIKHVLKVSLDVTRFEYYTLGTYFPRKDRYIPDNTSFDGWAGLRYDYGNFYASKSFYDQATKRRILWGWANESDSVQDDKNKGWSGIQATPRTLWLDSKGKQLRQWPIEEIKTLRGQKVKLTNTKLNKGDHVEIKGITAAQADVEVIFSFRNLDKAEKFDPNWVNAQDLCAQKGSQVPGGVGPFGLLTLASKYLEEFTPVFFRIFKATNNKHVVLLCSDASSSSLATGLYKPSFAGFVDADLRHNKLSLRSLIDHSVVESFGARGKTSILSRVYPSLAVEDDAHLHVFNNGSETITVKHLNAWRFIVCALLLEPAFSGFSTLETEGGMPRRRFLWQKQSCEWRVDLERGDQGLDFGSFRELDESDNIDDDEKGEDSDDDEDEDGFEGLNLSNRSSVEIENVGRIEEDEAKLRHPLVREVCRLVDLRSDWNSKFEGELRPLLRSLKPRQVCAVLHSFEDERVALKFFYWVDRQWRYRHDAITYYTMLESSWQVEECDVNLDFDAESWVEPNFSICNTAVHVLVMGNRLEKASRFLNRMEIVGIRPNVVTYNCLMKGYCNVHWIEGALELIAIMPLKGCYLDKVGYHTHGHGSEALEFLSEGKEKGFRFDKVRYSAIVGSFCKEGNIDMAKEIVNEMFSKGCISDVVTYISVFNSVLYSLINGLCQSGKSLEAREMMNISEEEWWTPNAITYSAVMHGLRREGKLAEACDLVEEIVNKGNSVEINLMIQSFYREGKMDKAKKFMEWCPQNGCAVNVVNFTTLIHGYCPRDDLETAVSLLDDTYLSNKHPDAVTYTTVVNALGRKGRIDEANELVMRMLGRGLDPTPVTYGTVIHWYSQSGRVEDLVKLLDKMLVRQNFKTAYNLVIEKLCSLRILEEADKLLSKVLRTASRIDANTSLILMDSNLSIGLPLSFYRVANRMFHRNMVPDIKLCEKVSKRLMLEGNSKEPDNLMLRFVERGRISPQGEERMKS
ncbi:hypothetical protein TIFTF001_023661 [Ficus carica]|uniref:Uncharacterized protein n=1 Tax=Ficus carica TaxID=3494 RepID=A0AA88DDZ5_FICCA|nr:hypothetical protein TIFTF001_023661 [Ficus carica]